MIRKLLVGLSLVIVVSNIVPKELDASLVWDVEVSGSAALNTSEAFPCYFQNVAPYDEIDCSFTLVVPFHQLAERVLRAVLHEFTQQFMIIHNRFHTNVPAHQANRTRNLIPTLSYL